MTPDNKVVIEVATPEKISRIEEHHNCEQMRKIFISSIHYESTKSSIEDYFSVYGDIKEVLYPMDKKTKKGRGFCYVIYNKSCFVDRVMDTRPHVLDGRTLALRRAIEKGSANNPAANVRDFYHINLITQVNKRHVKISFMQRPTNFMWLLSLRLPPKTI